MSREHYKVLIVEDSETMRMVCWQMLTDEGFECGRAASAEEAWQLLTEAVKEDSPYNGMLLDWILPTLSGAELMERIMADERFHELAIMIFTERPDEDTWRIAVGRVNADIQLKEELDLLPQRMRKFLTLHSGEVVSSPGLGGLVAEDEHGEGEKIMLVDDSLTICAKYGAILQEAGYEVVTANSMLEGIEVARYEKPRLAVVDYYMPGGNGDELCRKLLSDPQVSNIAVVMFSQRKEVMEMALEAGAMDLIYKDDPLHIFLKRIGAIMQLIRSQRSARQIDLLRKSMNSLGIGVMLKKGEKFSAFNQPMRDFEKQCGGLSIFSQLPSTGGDLHVEDTMGQKRYFEINHIHLSDQEQANLVRDITQRRRAEGQAKRNHEVTQKILEVLPVGVVIIDREKIIRNVNKTGLVMMGRSKEEVVGCSCHEHFCPGGECTECPIFDLGQTSDSTERILHCADDREIPILKTVLPLILDDEEMLLETFVDITMQKEAESTLVTARKKAEEASRSKSDFLANMSHEIRTPMNAVIGLSHLALQTELSPKQEEYLDKIELSANSLLQIINDILDFSKIEAGHLKMEKIPFHLGDVMTNLANVVSVNAQDKDIEVLFRISDDTPSCLRGDPLRLGQILINITNNAIKFTEKGEVLVSTSLISEDEEQVTMQFRVRDSGIGMTPEQKAKLFSSFAQADTSTTRKFGGTGLGLSICKCLVEMMDGTIEVQSEIDHGSEFIVTVTLSKETSPAERKDLPLKMPPMRVLVVDDNSTAREVLEDMLTNMGARVVLASSGQEAIETIKEEAEKGDDPYNLVLMDWRMPDMDGVETSRKIEGLKSLSVTPRIIMATAYGHERVRQEAVDISVDEFLMKPILPDILAEAIHKSLGVTERSEETEERVEEVTAVEEVKESKEISATETDLNGKRILLVEDNKVNQMVAREILQNGGITVELAENGKEAVQQVKETSQPFAAILMDVMMPEMDGLEATRLIRGELGEDKLPIIAMTASAMQQDQEACLQSGMNDVVTKPVNVEHLFNTLRKWIGTGAAGKKSVNAC